jgi:AcrR family transcriptional regulator
MSASADRAPSSVPDQATAPRVEDYPHGRVPRAVREQQIRRIALRLFAEGGYQATSMDDIATAAGVSKPVVYDLVGNKEELYLACVDAAGRELAEVVSTAALSTTGPEQRMRAGAVAFIRYVAERGGGWDLLLTAGPEPGAEPIHALRRQQSALIASLTAETLQAIGAELEPWKVGSLAAALNGAFEGLAYWWRTNPDVDPERLVDWVTEVLNPGIAALAATAPPPTS